MNIHAEEWYPVYTVTGPVEPEHEELFFRYQAAEAKFAAVQADLAAIHTGRVRREEDKRRHESDVAFVLRQRPWWSRARAELMVASRKRSGHPLRSPLLK